MVSKVLLTLSIYAVFDSVLSQCIGRDALTCNGLGSPFVLAREGPLEGIAFGAACGLGSLAPAAGLAASYGGGLTVTSSSPIAPTGLMVESENAIEGTVTVVGQLPFLGAVATEGAFTTAGAGAVSYGCGDGAVGMVTEMAGPPQSYGLSPAPYGYAPMNAYSAMSPFGCGCGIY